MGTMIAPKTDRRHQNPGRPKGSKNTTTQRKSLELKKIVEASGLTPLEFMLGVMLDEAQPMPVRSEMAIAAAPYVHPKISAIELTGKDGGPLEQRIVALVVDGTEAMALARPPDRAPVTLTPVAPTQDLPLRSPA